MQRSRIDLNLFTVFDAIYREGGITPASKQLHLSQPAVSHALARLRELLHDPLFERRGNVMIPTALARDIASTVGASLDKLEVMLQRSGQFDPGVSQSRFTVAVSGSNELSLLPPLVSQLAREAPGIEIATVRIDRSDLEEDLRSGELDLAIDIGLPLSAEIRRERVFSNKMVVLAREAHPAIQGSIDLDTYLAQEHVLVTGRRHGNAHEDVALRRMGFSRQIRVRCQRHAVANEIVARTDLLATMSLIQADLVNVHVKNQVLALPVEIPPIEGFIYWQAKTDKDPEACWFRNVVRTALNAGLAKAVRDGSLAPPTLRATK